VGQGRPTLAGSKAHQTLHKTPAPWVKFPAENILVYNSTRSRLEGLMSQSGSMRFLLVSVVFALFFGAVAVV
jgi:hypothetical protein